MDTDGNLYVVGNTAGRIGPDPKPGGFDAFIAKVSAQGQFAWVHMLGTGQLFEGAGDAVVDSEGNVFVTGTVGDALPGQTHAGSQDGFVAKYDSNGVRQWLVQFGGAASESATAIALDASGSVFVVGRSTGNLPGQTSFTSGGHFLMKLSAAGQQQWLIQDGNSSSIANGVAVDGGDVFLVGTTTSPLNGGMASGQTDIFIARHDTSGNRRWTRQLGSTAADEGWGVATNGSHVFFVGNTSGQLDGQPLNATQDVVVGSYSVDGNKQWVRTSGSLKFGRGSDVAVTGTGVYLAGAIGRVGSVETSARLSKWSLQGDHLWTRQVGTTGSAEATALTINGPAVWIAGGIYEALDDAAYEGDADAFVTRYNEDGFRY